MSATKKALAATLKDISITLHTIGAGLIPRPLKEYNIAKANYFYGKVGKDVKEWLVEIDRIIEANNVAARRRVAVVITHLRDTAVD